MLNQIDPDLYKIICNAVKDTTQIPTFNNLKPSYSLLFYKAKQFSKTSNMRSNHDPTFQPTGICSLCKSDICPRCSKAYIMDYSNSIRELCLNCSRRQIMPKSNISSVKLKQPINDSYLEINELKDNISDLETYTQCLLNKKTSNYFSIYSIMQMMRRKMRNKETSNELINVFVMLMNHVYEYYKLAYEESEGTIELIENYIYKIIHTNLLYIDNRLNIIRKEIHSLQLELARQYYSLIESYSSLITEIEEFNKIKKEIQKNKKKEKYTLLRSKAFILKEKTLAYNKLAKQFDREFTFHSKQPYNNNNAFQTYLLCIELNNIKIKLKELPYTIYGILYKQLDMYYFQRNEILRSLKTVIDQYSPEETLINQVHLIQDSHLSDETMLLPKHTINVKLPFSEDDLNNRRIYIINEYNNKEKKANHSPDSAKKTSDEGLLLLSESRIKSNTKTNKAIYAYKPSLKSRNSFLRSSDNINTGESDSVLTRKGSNSDSDFVRSKKTPEERKEITKIGGGIPESVSM